MSYDENKYASSGYQDDEYIENKRKRKHITCACENCKRAKVRCNGYSPCERCKEKELNCTYVKQRKRGLPSRKKPKCEDTPLMQSNDRHSAFNEYQKELCLQPATSASSQDVLKLVPKENDLGKNTAKSTMLDIYFKHFHPRQITSLPSKQIYFPSSMTHQFMQKTALLFTARSYQETNMIKELEGELNTNAEYLFNAKSATTLDTLRSAALYAHFQMTEVSTSKWYARTITLADSLRRGGVDALDLTKVGLFTLPPQILRNKDENFIADTAQLALEKCFAHAITSNSETNGTTRQEGQFLRSIAGDPVQRIYLSHCICLEEDSTSLYSLPAWMTIDQYQVMKQYLKKCEMGLDFFNDDRPLMSAFYICLNAVLEESINNYEQAHEYARLGLHHLQTHADMFRYGQHYLMIALHTLFKVFLRRKDFDNAHRIVEMQREVSQYLPRVKEFHLRNDYSLKLVKDGKSSVESLFEPPQSLIALVTRHASPLAFTPQIKHNIKFGCMGSFSLAQEQLISTSSSDPSITSQMKPADH